MAHIEEEKDKVMQINEPLEKYTKAIFGQREEMLGGLNCKYLKKEQVNKRFCCKAE